MDVLAQFIQHLEVERRYSPLTVRNYRRDIELFAEYIVGEMGAFEIERVTSDELRAWVVQRSSLKELKSSSINRELSSLRALFRWAHQRGVVDANPAKQLTALKTSRPLPVFIAESRMNSVMERCYDKSDSGDYIAERDALIVQIFYSTGLRLSELASLSVDSFAHDYATLRVMGKGGKEREVPIVSTLRSRIKSYVADFLLPKSCKCENFPLFLSKAGARLSNNMLYRIVRRELGEAGMHGKRSPHVLRHTFATHLLNEGADMREIQELLGHSSLRATQLYTHSSIEHLKSAYKRAHPRSGAGGAGGRGDVVERGERGAGEVVERVAEEGADRGVREGEVKE